MVDEARVRRLIPEGVEVPIPIRPVDPTILNLVIAPFTISKSLFPDADVSFPTDHKMPSFVVPKVMYALFETPPPTRSSLIIDKIEFAALL